MDNYTGQLEGIERKIHKLLGQYGDLLERYEFLRQENLRLKQELSAGEEKMKQLEQGNQVLKISKQLGSAEGLDKNELKRRITEFINEIDRCVALLNN